MSDNNLTDQSKKRASAFAAALQVVNTGKTVPVMSLIKEQPILAATISKLISAHDKVVTHDRDGNREIDTRAQGNFAQISQQIANKTADSEAVTQLFPEMELSAQILISSIISPKDMVKTELNFIAPDTIPDSAITTQLITKVSDYFEKDYKIEPLLPKILRAVLFESGSYVIAVIPENSVDDMINSDSSISKESLTIHWTEDKVAKRISILGNPISDKNARPNISLESLINGQVNSSYVYELTHDNAPLTGSYLHITDNFNALKMPAIIDKIQRTQVSKAIKSIGSRSAISTESAKINDRVLSGLVYKNYRGTKNVPIVKVKTNDEISRKTIGQPLVMKLPSESVIPVFRPGDPTAHIGYFVMIDGEGNPVAGALGTDHMNDLQSRLNSGNSDMASFLLNRAKTNMTDAGDKIDFRAASQIYSDIVEADLLSRLRNGVYGNNVSITRNEDIYQIMLARALKQQYTQLLYIPIDLITYFAYQYDKRGVGKSLLDEMRILNSLRAMTMFSRVMANVRNSIGRTQAALKLDERDPNPKKSIEIAIHEVSKLRQQYFPLGISTAGDIVDWLQKAGIEFTFSGHPGLPDMSIDFTEKSTSYIQPDDGLEEDLRKRSIQSLGLSPETVDNAFSTEFATTAVANNLLLAKRVLQIQEVFIPQLEDHVKKMIFNDGRIYEEMLKLIEENIDKIKDVEGIEPELLESGKSLVAKLVLGEFISNLRVSLPQPNSVTLENQMEAFDKYVEALDKALGFYISSEIFTTDMAGEAAQKAEDIKQIIKAHYCRKWLSENNVLSELTELISLDDDGQPKINFVDQFTDHINALTKSSVTLLKGTKPVAKAGDSDIERITGGEDLQDSVSTGGSDTSTDIQPDSGDGSDIPNDLSAGTDIPSDLPPLDSIE